MRVNTRARKAAASAVAGDAIEAIVPFNHLGGGGVAYDGTIRGGRSLFANDYAVDRGIDLDDPRLRTDLLQSWCALTATQLVFSASSRWAVRPKPGKLIERIDRTGVRLNWGDLSFNGTSRMWHIEFPDGTHLLTTTFLRGGVQRNRNDEPDLFVQAFGPAATRLTDTAP